MAIAQVKKIRIVGHRNIYEKVMEILQKKGVVEIRDLRQELPEEYFAQISQESNHKENLRKAESLLEFIDRFGEKTGFLKNLTQERVVLSPSELATIAKEVALDELYNQMKKWEEELGKLQQERRRLCEEKNLLLPWRKLGLPLCAVADTEKTRIVTGRIPSKNYAPFLGELDKATGYWALWVVDRDAIFVYGLLVFLKEEEESISSLQKKYGWEEILLPKVDSLVGNFLAGVERRVREIEEKEEEIKKEAASFSLWKHKIAALYDYYYNLSLREEARRLLACTSHSFLLSGWIPARDVGELKRTLEGRFPEIEVIVTDPERGERVPVILENKRAIQPFEVVTDLYGRPMYGTVDPTPYLAPFFAIFFGFCLTDAGYGLLLFLLSLVGLKKLKLGEMGRRFLRLVCYGGLASIFWGAITGGWFGDIVDRLPAGFGFLKGLKQRLVAFDPLRNSLLFLGIAVGLGFIQVITGVVIKLWEEVREKDWQNAFLRELPALGIQICLPVILGSYLFRAIPPGSGLVLASLGTFVLCSLAIFLYQWITNEGVLFKLFWCWFGWYGVVTGNSLADVLSYLRLFALGLTSGLLASAINEISLLFRAIPYAGFLIGGIVFCLAHFLNMAMNAFGGYVHTSRLQYLEFFMKFFSGGGDVFTPFAEERRYTILTYDRA